MRPCAFDNRRSTLLVPPWRNAQTDTVAHRARLTASPLNILQRTIGNRAVTRLFRAAASESVLEAAGLAPLGSTALGPNASVQGPCEDISVAHTTLVRGSVHPGVR